MVVVRDVLCRVKSAVRIREEKKLQSCHGIDLFSSAANFIHGLNVPIFVLLFSSYGTGISSNNNSNIIIL